MIVNSGLPLFIVFVFFLFFSVLACACLCDLPNKQKCNLYVCVSECFIHVSQNAKCSRSHPDNQCNYTKTTPPCCTSFLLFALNMHYRFIMMGFDKEIDTLWVVDGIGVFCNHR